MYEVLISDRAKKQLQKLDKGSRSRIAGVIERIRIRPLAYAKSIVNSRYYRVRAGDYRVIIDIRRNQLVILIVEVRHRSRVYKRME